MSQSPRVQIGRLPAKELGEFTMSDIESLPPLGGLRWLPRDLEQISDTATIGLRHLDESEMIARNIASERFWKTGFFSSTEEN